MSYKIKATFADGVTQEDVYQTVKASVDNPNSLMEHCIRHHATIENGFLVFTEEWASREAYEDFKYDIADPALRKAGIASPKTVEIE